MDGEVTGALNFRVPYELISMEVGGGDIPRRSSVSCSGKIDIAWTLTIEERLETPSMSRGPINLGYDGRLLASLSYSACRRN